MGVPGSVGETEVVGCRYQCVSSRHIIGGIGLTIIHFLSPEHSQLYETLQYRCRHIPSSFGTSNKQGRRLLLSEPQILGLTIVWADGDYGLDCVERRCE